MVLTEQHNKKSYFQPLLLLSFNVDWQRELMHPQLLYKLLIWLKGPNEVIIVESIAICLYLS